MPGMAGPPPVARDATVHPVGIGRRRTGTGPRQKSRRTTPISGHDFPSAPPQIRFPPGSTPGTADPLISQALPLPRGGAGAERRRRGWGGATWITVSGELETGEGEQVPPPRQPLPPWRYPHGPVHGNKPEKSRIRFPAGSTPSTAAHLISPRTDPAPKRGRGRSAAGAGGVGGAGATYGCPREKAREE